MLYIFHLEFKTGPSPHVIFPTTPKPAGDTYPRASLQWRLNAARQAKFQERQSVLHISRRARIQIKPIIRPAGQHAISQPRLNLVPVKARPCHSIRRKSVWSVSPPEEIETKRLNFESDWKIREQYGERDWQSLGFTVGFCHALDRRLIRAEARRFASHHGYYPNLTYVSFDKLPSTENVPATCPLAHTHREKEEKGKTVCAHSRTQLYDITALLLLSAVKQDVSQGKSDFPLKRNHPSQTQVRPWNACKAKQIETWKMPPLRDKTSSATTQTMKYASPRYIFLLLSGANNSVRITCGHTGESLWNLKLRLETPLRNPAYTDFRNLQNHGASYKDQSRC